MNDDKQAVRDAHWHERRILCRIGIHSDDTIRVEGGGLGGRVKLECKRCGRIKEEIVT